MATKRPPKDDDETTGAGRAPVPGDLDALNALWREVALAEDDDGVRLRRQLLARVRRMSHEEKHPGCKKILVHVPPSAIPGPHNEPQPFKIGNATGERVFLGDVEVYECEARELLHMIDQNRRVDRDRMRERRLSFDLGTVANLARQIASET